MARPLPRALFAFSAFALAFGAFMHTRAFPRTADAVSSSNIAPFFGSSLQALWLIDSAVLLTVAAIFGLVAVRPADGWRRDGENGKDESSIRRA